MRPEDVSMIRQVLPDEMMFHYYADRQSPWLLSQLMDDTATIGSIKQTSFARLLVRPLVRPMVSRCGGWLRRHDALAVAHAERAMRFDTITSAGLAGLDAAYCAKWHDFRLTFGGWSGPQTTRRAHNLVVLLGFPSEHAALLSRYDQKDASTKFQDSWHPTRADGRPTLAWSRLDLDLSGGHCLIEEIQSDWLRFVTWERQDLERSDPRSRALRLTQAYERDVLQRYGRIWAEVMMLAVLALLRDEFAVRTVWMHQPGPGAMLKGINWGGQPPRSIYSSLPRSFCFAPTRAVPPFLPRKKRNALRRFGGQGDPLFWRLRFDSPLGLAPASH